MGAPFEVNSVLKLTEKQGFPEEVLIGPVYTGVKEGYRLYPIHCDIPLVGEDWIAKHDAVIESCLWNNGRTQLTFRISRIYDNPFPLAFANKE